MDSTASARNAQSCPRPALTPALSRTRERGKLTAFALPTQSQGKTRSPYYLTDVLVQRGVNPATVANAPSEPGYCVGRMPPPYWRGSCLPPMRRAQHPRQTGGAIAVRSTRGAGAASHQARFPDAGRRPGQRPHARAAPPLVYQWAIPQARCRHGQPHPASQSGCKPRYS